MTDAADELTTCLPYAGLWDGPALIGYPIVNGARRFARGAGQSIAIETPSENSAQVDPDELAREARARRFRVGQGFGLTSDLDSTRWGGAGPAPSCLPWRTASIGSRIWRPRSMV